MRFAMTNNELRKLISIVKKLTWLHNNNINIIHPIKPDLNPADTTLQIRTEIKILLLTYKFHGFLLSNKNDKKYKLFKTNKFPRIILKSEKFVWNKQIHNNINDPTYQYGNKSIRKLQ